MSLLAYTFTYILVALLLFTSDIQATNGQQHPTSQDISVTSSNTYLQQSNTAAKRIIHIGTSSIYDPYISLSEFMVCLSNIGSMDLVFYMQSCQDARLVLFAERGLNGTMYEIVIEGRKKLSYIQETRNDGIFIVSNISYNMIVSCNNYTKFTMSWKHNRILLKSQNGNEISMLQKSDEVKTLTFATAATGFGATGKWKFELKKQVSTEPVKTIINTIQRSSLNLCPSFATECTSSNSDPLEYDGDPLCEENKKSPLLHSIYLPFNCSELCGIKCRTEFLQMTVCNTTNKDCTECNITNYKYNVTSLCQSQRGNVRIKVMDIEVCGFSDSLKMYFRFVHYKLTDHGYRTILVSTPSKYDYLMSLFRFQICLRSLENMNLTFYIKSCHNSILALLYEKGLEGRTYEIVIGADYSYIRKKSSDGILFRTNKLGNNVSNCEEYRKFWISWANKTVRLSNYRKTIQTVTKDNTDLMYATVTSMSESSDTEWKFTFQDEGMRQPVTVHWQTNTTAWLNLMLCPFETDCNLNYKNHSTCNPILTDLDVACENSTVKIYFKCNTVAKACTRELIQLAGCTSHVKSRCKTCKITDNSYNVTYLCSQKYPRTYIEVMKVNTCDFFDINGWNIYFRYLHIYETNRDDATTLMPSTSSSTVNRTSTKTTQTTTSTTASTTLSTSKTSITIPQSPTSTTASEKSTSLNIFSDTGQKSSTPLTIGIAVGVTGLFLAVTCVIILLIFIRRSRSAFNKQANTNLSKGDDYTGNQSIALPSAGNITHSDQYSDIQHECEEQHYQELIIIDKCDTDISYDSIDTSDVIHKSESKISMNNKQPGYVRQFDDMSDNQSKANESTYSVLDSQETGFNRSQELPQSKTEIVATETETSSPYAVLDPTVTGFDRSYISTVNPAETYTILDPNETGFNRMETTNQSEYEMAKPLTDDEIKENSEQPYSSEYNELGGSVSEKMMDNVYSHSVDNVYDSASHSNKPNKSDEIYDHLTGQ